MRDARHAGPGRRPRAAFVTLHVGAGTFAPVKVDDIAAHRMHRAERYSIPQATVDAIAAASRAKRRRVVAGAGIDVKLRAWRRPQAGRPARRKR